MSGPSSFRTGRAFGTADVSAAGRGLSALGQGIEGLGIDLRAAETKKRNDTIALEGTTADGNGIRDLNDLERSFDADSDYGTFDKRFEAGVAKIRDKWAASITDTKAREMWAAEFNKAAAPARNRILDLGEKRQREDRLVTAKNGLEGYQSVIADPDAADEDRTRAKRSAEASIAALHESGELSPSEAEDWRDKIINGGDFVFGEREIERKGLAAVSGTLPANVGGRANVAMGFFQSKGYTKEQAAGIVGNLIAESSLQSSGAIGDNGTAFGIAQWRGERLTRLKRFAASQGKSWQDFGTQLAFVDMELQNHETAAYNALKNAKTVDEATAAFIGYERPRGWTADNPRGGHNFKGRLTFAAQASGEVVKPEWFTNLSPERQLALEQRASAQQREMDNLANAQLTATRKQTKDDYSLRIATTDPSLTREEILSNPALDNGDKAALVNSYNEKMKEGIATAEAIRLFSDGNLSVDPFDEKGRKTVDSVYDTSVKAIAPEQVQPLTEELVRQTGVVPQGALNSIRAGVQATDVAQVTASLQAAQRISQINPAALGRRNGGNEIQTAADDFRHYVDDLNLAPEQAAQRVMENRDPAKQRERKAIEPAAKEFVKSMQDIDLASEFNDSWFRGDPSLGFTPSQELGIKADFLALAEDQFFRANGDPEIAKNRAVEEMKRLYGVTEFGGVKAVVKHPPERYWPTSRFQEEGKIGTEQSLGYASKQLHDDVTAIEPNADLSTIQLITTPETDAMVKRGELPGYAILYKDANGMFQTVPGKLWRPDVSKAMEVQQGIDVAKKVLDVSEARKLQTQERQQLPFRQQGMDDFLSGNDPVFGER